MKRQKRDGVGWDKALTVLLWVEVQERCSIMVNVAKKRGKWM